MSLSTLNSSTLSTPLAIQREFDLCLSANRPLVPLEAAMCILDRNEDDLLNLIELGMIAVAFDIKHPTAERREVRIWRRSLSDYVAGKHLTTDGHGLTRMGEGESGKVGKWESEDVIAAILPQSAIRNPQSTIRGRELMRRFTCSSTHFCRLVECGELVASVAAKRGPNGSPLVTRASVVEFLKRRRI